MPTRAAGLAIAVLLASGCGGDGGAAPSEGLVDTTTLRIAMTDPQSTPFLAVVEVAEQNGWWAEEGLEIDVLVGLGGGNNVQAMVAGSADLAIAAPLSTVAAAMDDDGVTLIGAYFNANDYAWITFDDAAELNGATLGVSSPLSGSELMVKAYMADHPEAGVEAQIAGGFGDQLAAAREGRITAAVSVSPFTQQAVADGARVLVTGRELVGDVPAGLVAVDAAYAAEHPEALEAFWRVIARGFQYYRDDAEAAADQLAEIMPVERQYILDAITGDNAAGWTIAQDAAIYENLGAVLRRSGAISGDVDWATLVDQRYLPEDARADLSTVSAT